MRSGMLENKVSGATSAVWDPIAILQYGNHFRMSLLFFSCKVRTGLLLQKDDGPDFAPKAQKVQLHSRGKSCVVALISGW